MTSAAVDILYSIERWLQANWTATTVHFADENFTRGSATGWLSASVLMIDGQATRGSQYGARVRITCTAYSTTSRRAAMTYAQTLEGKLRAVSILLYRASDQVSRGAYIRLGEPSTQQLPTKDGLSAAVVDVDGVLYL